MKFTLGLCFLLTHWLLFGEGREVRFKLDVQGLGGGRILDVGGQGGGWSPKLDDFHGLCMCIIPKYTVMQII